MTELAIRVEGLGKRYRRGIDRHGQLFDLLLRRQKPDWFWALREVSFEVRPGELFGIIGRNGAGKTTLLRILARITRPNEGRVELRGRVASLIQVGAGFHPELSGRENVFLNGALLGMRRAEVLRKFDAIVDYAGVSKFLDTPMKRFSSGMTTRLGFAIAAHLDQEIMLVDEVLAVSDAEFRLKAMRKIEELTREGRTVLFVGHNMSIIQASCQRALWLEDGQIREIGEAREVVSAYVARSAGTQRGEAGFVALPLDSEIPGDPGLRLTHLRFLDSQGQQVPSFTCGDSAQIAVGYEDESNPRSDMALRLTLRDDRHPIATLDTSVASVVGDGLRSRPASGEILCEIPRLPLMPGSYGLTIESREGRRVVQRYTDLVRLEITEGDFYGNGELPAHGTGPTLIDYSWRIEPGA